MRKILSILLAVLIVASVCVISFHAASTGVATVTLVSVKGDEVTKTYAVGDSITAYTYLNTTPINDGKVGCLDCTQYYTNSVLELADPYDPKEGDIQNVEEMFPVTKTATMAGGQWTESEEDPSMGAIYYNASIANTGGFKFNAEGKALIISHYKVKAAGTATINNAMITLGASDENLTKIIHQSKILNNNFTSKVELSDPILPIPTGYTLSGQITTFKTSDTASENITVTLKGATTNYTDSVTVKAENYQGVKAVTDYSFENVPADTFTVTVSKENHVPREYEVQVSDATTQALQINPIGDVNLNGRVQSNDATLAYRHAQNADPKFTLTGYAFQCADVNRNGYVQANDATRIYQQAQGTRHPLF